jgi:5,10-methenyltetrahydromethanopterin hydrogenase
MVHGCKGFSAVEDLHEMREKIVQLAKIVGFNKVCLVDVFDVLMSEKEELSNEDLIEAKKKSRKQGRRVQKRLKLCVNSQAKDCPKCCESSMKL